MLKITFIQGFIFGLGVLTQTLNMIGITSDTRKKGINLLWVTGLSFISLFFIRQDAAPDIRSLFITYFLLFGFILAFAFKKEILPKISEKVILVFTLIFWYSWINAMGFSQIISMTIFIPALFPTALVFFVAFTSYRIPFVLKITLYAWFLIIVSSMGIHLYSDIIKSIFLHQPLPHFGLFELFLLGSSSLYLITNLTYLQYLIPLPAKSKSYSDRMKEWKKFVDLLANKYDKKQIEIWHSLIWTISLILIFFANYHYQWIHESTVIIISISLLSLSESGMTQKVLSFK